MPYGPAYFADPRFEGLGGEFADPVQPARFPRHILRFRNDRWAAHIGLGGFDESEWESAFARFA
ncbi:MAG: protein adenylyltransferase SelO family protein, partial [Hyphomonadaceae bacterium]